MANTREIINGATIETGSLSSGLLNPEQDRMFLRQAFESNPFGALIRRELRKAKTGEIDKIGIAKRILRKKTENSDDGYRASVNTDKIEYATTAVRLPWEITEETLRENIEGEGFEALVTQLMTTQLGLDFIDLCLNGNTNAASAGAFAAATAYSAGDIVTHNGGLYLFNVNHSAGDWNEAQVKLIGDEGDIDFLKVNDGWLKQLNAKAHIVDRQGSGLLLDTFYDALAAMPNKYNNGNLRWVMSPHMKQQWELFLLNKIIEKGGVVPDSMYKSPASIQAVECHALDDDSIILTDPKNLIAVNTYGTKIRKTTEGKEAVMQDKRFYTIHTDLDPIIEETDAAVLIKNIGRITA